MLSFVLYTILLNPSPSLAFTSPVEHSLGSGLSLLRARSSPANSTASLGHSTEQLQGWTSSPDGRGTIDIITSCFLTISLCAWTMLCLNVSPFGTSRIVRFLHKVMIFCEAVLGPEFIFQTSLGQWASARRSVSSFAASGLQGWTMKHGFFADMGGYVLDPPDFTPFPLNAKQLHYLVTRGYIDYAVVAITPDTIDDKNKSDEMARIITMIQVLWFVIDTIARAVQNLAISKLELSTIAYVWCSVGTSFFWRYKPQGINVPVVVVPKQTIAKILVNAGPAAAATYISTPMDFVGREKHHWGLYWAHWFNILYHMGWNMHTKKRPVDKISDDQFLPLSAGSNSILVFFQASFAGIHIAGWGFLFPTSTEALLWHICTIYIMVAMIMYWLIDSYTFQLHPSLRRRWHSGLGQGKIRTGRNTIDEEKQPSALWVKAHKVAEKFRNNSPDKDPGLYVPLKSVIPITFVAAVYCLARGYVVIDDLVNLRLLPASAYQSVKWSNFIPHI